MPDKTIEQTCKDLACSFSTLNMGLMMIGEAAQTARVLADGLDDEDEKHVADTLAESLDTVGDHFRIAIDYMRGSIGELRDAAHLEEHAPTCERPQDETGKTIPRDGEPPEDWDNRRS